MGNLLSAIERAVFKIVIPFGGVFALATMLWFASQRLRGGEVAQSDKETINRIRSFISSTTINSK